MGHQMRDAMARLRFAPMWMSVPKFAPASNAQTALPAPAPAYAEIWQPQWQEELGLTAEQKTKLLAINAKAVAEAKDHAERFKKLSQEEQQTQVKAWAGKSAPWRQQLDNEVCGQIAAVLTPQQLQTLKDYSFPAHAIGLLYDAKIRQEIGFGPEQEDRLRRLAKERLARSQEVSMERAEQQWDILTPQQQAALPEVVKHQGPTSAVLSIAWDLGFDLDNIVPGYPMLGESPVRKRLGLSAEQEKQLHVVMADSAAKKEKARQERFSRTAQPSQSPPDSEADAKKQVEAILTPQQLTMLNEINFRRQVALALGYPEKRKTVGITAQQAADFQRLDKEAHEQLYRIDRKMLGQAMQILTPHQRQQLQEEVDRRMHGDLPARLE
jgi:Spy/CpxP family protein refolding chaperone